MMWSVEESRALAVAVDNLPYRDVPAAIEAIHLEGAKASPSIEALPENVQAALPALVAAGGFNEAQRRVPKGNDRGGEWMDSAAGVVGMLERIDWQFDRPNDVKHAFDEGNPDELRRIANNLISGSASDNNDRAKRLEQADVLNRAADRMSEKKLTDSLQAPVPLPPGAHVIKGSPLSSLYGDALVVHGSGDGQSMDAISRFERGLTPEQHAVLAEHLKAAPGGGIYFGGYGSAVTDLDHNQSLNGQQPRGWTPGSTFEQVGGAYSDSTRSISIGDSGRMGTVIHEASHALDYAYGRKLGVPGGQVSMTPEWRTAATAMSKIGTRSYFSRSTNPTGWLSESFAEVGALISESRLHKGGEYSPAAAVADGLRLTGPDALAVAQQAVDAWMSINDQALGGGR